MRAYSSTVFGLEERVPPVLPYLRVNQPRVDRAVHRAVAERSRTVPAACAVASVNEGADRLAINDTRRKPAHLRTDAAHSDSSAHGNDRASDSKRGPMVGIGTISTCAYGECSTIIGRRSTLRADAYSDRAKRATVGNG